MVGSVNTSNAPARNGLFSEITTTWGASSSAAPSRSRARESVATVSVKSPGTSRALSLKRKSRQGHADSKRNWDALHDSPPGVEPWRSLGTDRCSSDTSNDVDGEGMLLSRVGGGPSVATVATSRCLKGTATTDTCIRLASTWVTTHAPVRWWSSTPIPRRS